MTDHSRAASSMQLAYGSDASPQDRLRDAVAALTRARRLQLLVDYGFGGLVAGLVLAAVAAAVESNRASSAPGVHAPDVDSSNETRRAEGGRCMVARARGS